MRNTAKIRDITGQKFNHLTAVRIASRNPLFWECRCDCGNTTLVRSNNLISGNVKSCGCIHHRGNPKHNLSKTRLYRIYAKIKRRCYILDDPAYQHYGGRGIVMCDEWKNSFEAFYMWANKNGYSDDLSIDRIDNDGIYSPQNCRWADKVEQANNRCRNRNYTMNGETLTLKQWCSKLQMHYATVHSRIIRGWSFEEAILYKEDARIIKRRKET